MIKFIDDIASWQISVTTQLHNMQTIITTALSEAIYSSFALGSRNWTISNDNWNCSRRGESYSRRLKLTGCMKGEFTCSDGQCIKMDERCDQIMDCNDESDEENCRLIVFKNNYNNKQQGASLHHQQRQVEDKDKGSCQGECVHQSDQRARHLREGPLH